MKTLSFDDLSIVLLSMYRYASDIARMRTMKPDDAFHVHEYAKACRIIRALEATQVSVIESETHTADIKVVQMNTQTPTNP